MVRFGLTVADHFRFVLSPERPREHSAAVLDEGEGIGDSVVDSTEGGASVVPSGVVDGVDCSDGGLVSLLGGGGLVVLLELDGDSGSARARPIAAHCMRQIVTTITANTRLEICIWRIS